MQKLCCKSPILLEAQTSGEAVRTVKVVLVSHLLLASKTPGAGARGQALTDSVYSGSKVQSTHQPSVRTVL